MHITPHQRAVAEQLSQGKSNKEIAASLGVEPRTIKNCMTSLMAKVGVHDRLQLALIVLSTGITKSTN